jgi:large subunit ribosomal protein L25
MLTIKAKIRKILGKKVKALRQKKILPAVLYGPGLKNSLSLEINLKEFEKIFGQVGESALISLEIADKKSLVLVHEIKRDPISGTLIHVDFYQPKAGQTIETKVPLVFEGVALAVKDLGGTLVKNIQEVHVRALPENLPHQILVDISGLKTFEDNILIKDLILQEGVKIMRELSDIVAKVVPAQKIEEELVKSIEDKAVEVEKVGDKEKAKEAEVKETVTVEKKSEGKK